MYVSSEGSSETGHILGQKEMPHIKHILSLRSIERQLNSFHSPLCKEKLFYIIKVCLAKVNQILSFLTVCTLAGTQRWFSVNTAS